MPWTTYRAPQSTPSGCFYKSKLNIRTAMLAAKCIFQPSNFFLQSLSAPRRRGRPKQMRASEVYRMAVEIAEGSDMLSDLLRDAAEWRSKVYSFCFLPG